MNKAQIICGFACYVNGANLDLLENRLIEIANERERDTWSKGCILYYLQDVEKANVHNLLMLLMTILVVSMESMTKI